MVQEKILVSRGTTLFMLMCLFVLFFQNSLQVFFPLLNYFDEFLSLAFFALYILQTLSTQKAILSDLVLIFLSFVCILIGFVGNYLSKGQSSFFFQVSDVVSIFRFILLYIGLKNYYSLNYFKINYRAVFKIIIPILKVYVLLLFTLSIVNIFKNINMSYDVRYGIRSFAFVFGTPGLVINQMTYALIFFTCYKINSSKLNVNIFIGLTLIIIAATLRARAFILIIVYVGLYFFSLILKSKHYKLKILIGSLVVTISGFSQFEYYFLNGSYITPRERFVTGAGILMKEYWPFGSGFGTFGSSAAAQNYSNIYYQLGFSSLRGLSPDNQLFLNDNYFPMIFGQLGILGGMIFVIILILFATSFVTNFFVNKCAGNKLISGFVIADIFLSSVQSSYLAHYSNVALIFIAMFCFGTLKKGKCTLD